MTYIPTTADLATRWRPALAAVAAAVALSVSSQRLWPFLGALLVFAVWVGFLAGRSQVRMWRRTPGIRLCSGVRHSAAMTFSLLAQMPVSVLTTSV